MTDHSILIYSQPWCQIWSSEGATKEVTEIHADSKFGVVGAKRINGGLRLDLVSVDLTRKLLIWCTTHSFKPTSLRDQFQDAMGAAGQISAKKKTTKTTDPKATLQPEELGPSIQAELGLSGKVHILRQTPKKMMLLVPRQDLHRGSLSHIASSIY